MKKNFSKSISKHFLLQVRQTFFWSHTRMQIFTLWSFLWSPRTRGKANPHFDWLHTCACVFRGCSPLRMAYRRNDTYTRPFLGGRASSCDASALSFAHKRSYIARTCTASHPYAISCAPWGWNNFWTPCRSTHTCRCDAVSANLWAWRRVS